MSDIPIDPEQFGQIFEDAALNTAFYRGFRAGVGRAALVGMVAEATAVVDAMFMAGEIIESASSRMDYEIAPHGLELLAELTAVAVTARIAHHEPGLAPDELYEFLPRAMQFINTFIGCGPPT